MESGSLSDLEEVSAPHSFVPLCSNCFWYMLDEEPLGQGTKRRVVVELYKPRAIAWAQHKPGRAPKEKELVFVSISFPLGANAGRLCCFFLFSLSFLR